MTIEKIIEKLEEIKKEYGDIDVCIKDVTETNRDFQIQTIKIENSRFGKYVSLQND